VFVRSDSAGPAAMQPSLSWYQWYLHVIHNSTAAAARHSTHTLCDSATDQPTIHHLHRWHFFKFKAWHSWDIWTVIKSSQTIIKTRQNQAVVVPMYVSTCNTLITKHQHTCDTSWHTDMTEMKHTTVSYY